MSTPGAVITADIVNSSLLENKDFNVLTRKLKSLISKGKGIFHFYRGDSFQCYLTDPYSAYRLALKLRSLTKSSENEAAQSETDLKISLGIGTIETPVIRISEAMGEAFIISGRELDNLETQGRRFIARSGDSKINIALDTISLFTDYLYKGLTLKQSEVLLLLLNGKTQQQIAGTLKKSQSTINRHVQALGWNEFEQLLSGYDKCVIKLLKNEQ